ncbi:efflux RND transporter periplasmic adaptor subunit [Mucilaginibacter lappiensis]|uniref:Cobalt-zinc-cadmium efflux system membrane fusion protein n=1 Tax=Mucilaginibacter lappiensis TaxID=354630 RepID=A0A1N6Q5J0_9SPHI|nr:efflux RND transporter periplasmic adaptor subunit [Mucilaginibacter lappiensis]MBB6107334.1 cobalt-zinc-cadmium efflux system membrane fusion protein [Mucilaginibacter lappiensis]MBB6126391.1 cobalt-zinc-cadmium efflux system membrane fusion protein [Mucilaginibacter lappiensis]SIQ11944.1 membrane fusion protein, cobalt-zinc-cadmium efflux system [Mucilaginibacter lappiensis]
MMKRETLLSGISALLLLAACKGKPQPVAENLPVTVSDSMARMITIDTAKTTAMKDELSLSGEVSYDDNNVIKVFPFAGGQIQEVKVSLGDKVTKGQTLAVMRSADIAGNYTDLTATRSDLAIAKRQLEQAEYLYKNGISSERDYTEAKENYNKAAAASTKIQQQIAINGGGNTSASGSLVIKAPESGFIVEKSITAGSFIRPDNSGNMFTISNMKDVWIWANVFESDISKVKVGYTAKVTTVAYPGKVFIGKVNAISSVLDPDNKVMKIKIVLPNTDMLLKPEMFTNVVISNNDKAQSVAVPAKAVIFDNSKYYVVVYNSKSDLKVREVSVIKTVDDVSYISSGLNAGDKIISKNQLLFYDALMGDK